jgi:outer membrane receptor protein involved in Fe transport
MSSLSDKRIMKHRLHCVGLLFTGMAIAAVGLLPLPLCGQAEDSPAPDHYFKLDIEALTKVSIAVTRIATKTEHQSFQAPGLISVLLGRDLLAKGVRTVGDALILVPGIEPSFASSGTRQFVVRGIGKTFASGNIKFLLNDIPMNSTFTGQALPLLELPIEQVDRIEVIRGPGSAIHGEFAYSGVVNVITIAEKNQGFSPHLPAPGWSPGTSCLP